MKTRKEFLEAVAKTANVKDLHQVDRVTQAVVSLTKLIIGDELSQEIANVLVPDLRQGWDSISIRSLCIGEERGAGSPKDEKGIS
jgi:uncharacterized protein (DUF2267 family)